MGVRGGDLFIVLFCLCASKMQTIGSVQNVRDRDWPFFKALVVMDLCSLLVVMAL